ncbi:unnamed protein product [Oppiella nova]|uniref:CTNNB1 binding N-teminal domain-containing protein n=1 Tax=Oppiella nova TaxID=334625 RepID=A0A7R9Q8Z7_9ACAR|nr:unnamed protein product [Oppiella nova]CAG2158841.1 unnamed protein product [Oppiella nova]
MPHGSDDLASSDELKVFKDEGEEENRVVTEHNLNDLKSSLITEGEQRRLQRSATHFGYGYGYGYSSLRHIPFVLGENVTNSADKGIPYSEGSSAPPLTSAMAMAMAMAIAMAIAVGCDGCMAMTDTKTTVKESSCGRGPDVNNTTTCVRCRSRPQTQLT